MAEQSARIPNENTDLAPIDDDIEPVEAPREDTTKMKNHWKRKFQGQD